MTQPKTALAYLRSEKAKAEQQLRYYKYREKILEHQIPELTRKARVHRLCTRAGMLESFLIAPEELTNDQVIHDIFIKKNFKLTKDAYAAQHKEELDTFNKAVRTLMKLNGSTAVDFSALDAEFSALQSSSAELRTQLEILQPDISALKNVRKYIDMVLNKQQLSAPGGKTPEKESVLKKLEQLQQKKSNYKTISTTPNREESL